MQFKGKVEEDQMQFSAIIFEKQHLRKIPESSEGGDFLYGNCRKSR